MCTECSLHDGDAAPSGRRRINLMIHVKYPPYTSGSEVRGSHANLGRRGWRRRCVLVVAGWLLRAGCCVLVVACWLCVLVVRAGRAWWLGVLVGFAGCCVLVVDKTAGRRSAGAAARGGSWRAETREKSRSCVRSTASGGDSEVGANAEA